MSIDEEEFNVTVGQELSFIVSVNDTEDDTFNWDVTIPDGASFVISEDETYGTFSWTPENHDTEDNIRYNLLKYKD